MRLRKNILFGWMRFCILSIKNLLEEKDAATAILRIYHHNIKQSHVIIALYLTNQSYNKPTQLFKRFYHIIKQFILFVEKIIG